MKVGFIGLGKLGMPCAEVMAMKHHVVGYDLDKRKSNKIEVLKSIKDVVILSEFIFIAVPTPHHYKYDGKYPTSHLKNKDFNYSIVKNVLKEVNVHLDDSKTVVLISTVLPGTIRRKLIKYINKGSFFYNPYLIAMGTVAWDFVNPEMLIIGNQNGKKCVRTTKLIKFYKSMIKKHPNIVVGTWDECECIKIFYNTFISAKLSLVNMIQDVAQKQGNINTDVVTEALKNSTQRIMGARYMTAGMGDGGSCHPRDNIALRWMSQNLDLGYDLFGAIMKAREGQAENMAKELIQYKLPVIIIGKAYKPGVIYEDGSYSILVGYYIKKFGHQVYYHDPLTKDFVPKKVMSATYLIAHDFEVSYSGTKAPKSKKLKKIMFKKNSIIVDPYRKCPPIKNCKVIHYGNTRLI